MHISEYLGGVGGVFIFYSEWCYVYCINYPAIIGYQMISELVERMNSEQTLSYKRS